MSTSRVYIYIHVGCQVWCSQLSDKTKVIMITNKHKMRFSNDTKQNVTINTFEKIGFMFMCFSSILATILSDSMKFN